MTVSPQEIRDLRKRMGWSQDDLARRVLVHQITISRWENGFRSPGGRTAERIRQFIDGTPEQTDAAA